MFAAKWPIIHLQQEDQPNVLKITSWVKSSPATPIDFLFLDSYESLQLANASRRLGGTGHLFLVAAISLMLPWPLVLPIGKTCQARRRSIRISSKKIKKGLKRKKSTKIKTMASFNPRRIGNQRLLCASRRGASILRLTHGWNCLNDSHILTNPKHPKHPKSLQLHFGTFWTSCVMTFLGGGAIGTGTVRGTLTFLSPAESFETTAFQ